MSKLNVRAWALFSFVLALCVGAAGGYLFHILDLPLPWMLGSMASCMVAAVFGLPVAAPDFVRSPTSAVIGVMLGASFPVDLFSHLSRWLLPMLGLVGFIVASAICCVGFFRYVARFDAKTAYFCGMPGGLIEMTVLGDEAGADTQRIALVHTGRIFLIVFILPFVVRFLSEERPQMGPASASVSMADVSVSFVIWLAVVCAAGMIFGTLLRLPARHLFGPMLISGVLHIGGITDFIIPAELVIIAQVTLGAAIGCTFAGLDPKEVGRILLLTLGSTLIMVALTGVFGFAISLATGIDPVALMLAYSPGGIAEMGLVALSLDLDTALIASHHVVRLVVVGLGAAIVFKLAQRLRRSRI